MPLCLFALLTQRYSIARKIISVHLLAYLCYRYFFHLQILFGYALPTMSRQTPMPGSYPDSPQLGPVVVNFETTIANVAAAPTTTPPPGWRPSPVSMQLPGIGEATVTVNFDNSVVLFFHFLDLEASARYVINYRLTGGRPSSAATLLSSSTLLLIAAMTRALLTQMRARTNGSTDVQWSVTAATVVYLSLGQRAQ